MNLTKINKGKFNLLQQEWLGSDWLGNNSAENAWWVLVGSKMNVSQQFVLVNSILKCINRSMADTLMEGITLTFI